MKPPCRVVLAPFAVGLPVGGSTDFAPPIHSGSRCGSNITAATRAGDASIVLVAVISMPKKRFCRSTAPDQSDRLIPFEQIEADPRRLATRTRKSAIAVEQQHRIAL